VPGAACGGTTGGRDGRPDQPDFQDPALIRSLLLVSAGQVRRDTTAASGRRRFRWHAAPANAKVVAMSNDGDDLARAKAKLAAFRKRVGPGRLTDEEAREYYMLRLEAGEKTPRPSRGLGACRA
jgi:hypothetical protein